MSPEQAAGRVVDERSDLYSLAVLLCRICTTKWPFPGDDGTQRSHWRDNNRVESLPDGLPEEIVPVLIRALERDPAERYPSARAMKVALTGG